MTGRLAVDFGTSNTVITVWNESAREGVPLHIPDFGRQQQAQETISLVPSLIHYTEDNRRWIGNQVLQKGLYHSNHTFRWMKRYISSRSPMRVRLDGREITPFLAGQDFLSTVLLIAGQEIGVGDEEIALSAPVEAYEHYENWLAGVAESAGMPRFRIIDEPSAAALGYGAHIQPGSTYLIFDFGGGTLHAAVVRMEMEESASGGRRCRVLGKAGMSIGGTSIDSWLFQEVLRLNNRHDSDEDIRRVSNALLVECERVKEELSFSPQADLSVINPETGAVIEAEFTTSSFEELLDRQELFTRVNQTVRMALKDAAERGFNEDAIQSVLMVGGSSQIPSVQRTLRQMFGRERVHASRPLDAVARGAAAFIAGVDFYDHIQHDYAIRYVNQQKGEYDYRVLVERGTAYPTQNPVAKLTIKAAYDGQRQLGITIFEIGQQYKKIGQPVELVFDPGGAARLQQLTAHEEEQRSLFWMNEKSPTFLEAEPPAQQGEPRFEVEFLIDENKRLVINARDLKSGQLTHQHYPVVRLT
ncbi:MAG TPA: Hsp70 family protein [Anaerolineaceae bacterium]